MDCRYDLAGRTVWFQGPAIFDQLAGGLFADVAVGREGLLNNNNRRALGTTTAAVVVVSRFDFRTDFKTLVFYGYQKAVYGRFFGYLQGFHVATDGYASLCRDVAVFGYV